MKRTFYKSYGLYSLAELEEMRKDYEDFQEEIDSYGKEEIEEAVMRNIEEDWNIFIEELTHSNLATTDCVIEGVLGLWDGKHTIQPVYANLGQCITKCVNNGDEVEIYEEDGELKIDAYHHDGVNNFTISQESGLPLNLMNKLYGA